MADLNDVLAAVHNSADHATSFFSKYDAYVASCTAAGYPPPAGLTGARSAFPWALSDGCQTLCEYLEVDPSETAGVAIPLAGGNCPPR
jgi:hypothetical protein